METALASLTGTPIKLFQVVVGVLAVAAAGRSTGTAGGGTAAAAEVVAVGTDVRVPVLLVAALGTISDVELVASAVTDSHC